MTVEEMRKEKARLMEKRNRNQYNLVDGMRNEMRNMADCMKLYKKVYSNTELLEIFQRWAEDLDNVNKCRDED